MIYHSQDGFPYWLPSPLEPGEQNPLLIIGGLRSTAPPSFERFVDDDSTINATIGKALREFYPATFEGRLERGKEPEMEWVMRSLLYHNFFHR